MSDLERLVNAIAILKPGQHIVRLENGTEWVLSVGKKNPIPQVKGAENGQAKA